MVEHDGKCITVFSAPNYCDQVSPSAAKQRKQTHTPPRHRHCFSLRLFTHTRVTGIVFFVVCPVFFPFCPFNVCLSCWLVFFLCKACNPGKMGTLATPPQQTVVLCFVLSWSLFVGVSAFGACKSRCSSLPLSNGHVNSEQGN